MKKIPLGRYDKTILASMKAFNRDSKWLKLNHPEAYKRLLSNGFIHM